jgi:flagellar basal-body rod protein FlgF
MDNAMYVVLSRQMTLKRELDIVANNLANADTAGFKVETLQVKTDSQAPARMADGPKALKFVLDDEVTRDFGQGAMQQTGGSFDLAIDGRGFFKVQTPAGERYTRDGRFTLSPEGKLTTQDGDPVLGDGGEIQLDPAQGPVNIGRDGTITQGTQRVGKVDVADFSDLSVLQKDGDNLFRNVSNLQPTTATAAVVRQGMLESSNVNSILQVTRLIDISRSYESMAKTMDNVTSLSRSAVERLGRVA